MHLRGPMNVSQIAVYSLANTISRQRAEGTVVNTHEQGSRRHEERLGQAVGVDYEHNSRQKAAAVAAEELVVKHATSSHLSSTSLERTSSVRPTAGCAPISCTTTVTTTLLVMATDCEKGCSSHIIHPTSSILSSNESTSLPTSLQQPMIQPSVPCPCATATSNAGNNTSSTTVPQAPQPPPPSTLVTITRRSSDIPAPALQATAAAVDWRRVAYYTSAAPAQATGFAFLANLGDPRKSGTFDYSFGNSLSYVTQDGRRVAPERTPFDGTLETSEIEMAAFTDKPCDENCDYYRPGSTAYYGWEGESKAFFIQFQMDHYDNVGTDQGMLSDAPAWWFLNAAIPRILQYGNDRNNIPCSCWSTGCGEFDAFEVLGRGEERAKSTIHRPGNIEGGDSNYFRRPVGRMLKFAVVFHNYNITAVVLDDGFDFSKTLAEDAIDSIIAYDSNSNAHSLFAIGT